MTIGKLKNSICVVFLTVGICACATLPSDYTREETNALPASQDTWIGQKISTWTDSHGGLSGFYPIFSGMDALGARLYLIEKSERSIDAQYFLMKDDHAGRILASALFTAADRGVRVRVLLDDIFTTAKDENLALLNQHPNIQIRLFNPIARDGFFHLNFLADFKRANRRMHNKSLTVDNHATIVGGRNIADEYFQLKTDAEFIDFDIIGVGPVATEVSATFDLFWNAEHSVPLEVIDDNANSSNLDEARVTISANELAADQEIYSAALQSAFMEDLIGGTLALYPSEAVVITDDPQKLVAQVSEQQQTLVNYLSEIARQAQDEIIIVTPYFVPQTAGTEFWREITAKGVRVVILTNSLASTNHIAVHSGYARHRKEILEAGVVLYEARANAIDMAEYQDGSSPQTLTLHSKGVILDRKAVFVGSLNMDPRSIDINTEMGILIRSPEMANSLAENVLTNISEFAYEVKLDETGQLRWRGIVDGSEITETSEPLASRWRKLKAFLLKIVPEGQL